VPGTLGRGYLWWCWAHLAAFLGLGVWGLLLLGVR